MNPYQPRPLGRTSLSLTALGFGGSSVGNLYAPVSEADAMGAIGTAYEAGVRYFDTAPLYGNGLGEHRMGRALRDRPRGDFVLSTKVGRLLDPLPPGKAQIVADRHRLPFQLRYDYSYDGVMRSMEHSLQRLGMNQVDMVLIHDIDAHNQGADQGRRFRDAMTGSYPALARLRDGGAITAIGVGVNDWKVCAACLESADFDCFLLAGRYTLLEHEALQTLLPACTQRGVGVIVGAPYNSGILARGAVEGATYFDGPPPPAVRDKVGRMERVCAAHGVSLAAAALRFPLGHPAVASVLPGVRSADGVRRTLDLFDETIPDDLWLQLKSEGLIHAEAPIPPN